MGAEVTQTGNDVLAAVLGLGPPWKIEAAEVDIHRRLVAVRVGFDRGGRFVCPACGFGGAAAYDSTSSAWRLLDGLAGWVTEIRARVPRARCQACGKIRRVVGPWESVAGRKRGAPKSD